MHCWFREILCFQNFSKYLLWKLTSLVAHASIVISLSYFRYMVKQYLIGKLSLVVNTALWRCLRLFASVWSKISTFLDEKFGKQKCYQALARLHVQYVRAFKRGMLWRFISRGIKTAKECSKCCQFMCSLKDRKSFQSCCKCMPQNPHIALLPFNYTKGNIEKSAPSQISYIKSIFNQPPLHPPFTLKQGVVNLQLDLENSQSWFCKLVDKFAWFPIFCFFCMARAAEWRSGSVLGP